MNHSLSVAAGESNVLTPTTSVNSQPQSEPPREEPSEARSPGSRPAVPPVPPGQTQPPPEPVTPKATGKNPPSPVTLRFLVCSLMMVASLFMVIWNLQEGSLQNANTGSRYATIQSLIDYGTFHIDKSQYVHTIDKYKVGDHYISSKPPTLPTIGAGIYWVYRELTGKTIARYEGDVVRTISFFTGGVCHILFLIYFYRLCCLLFRRQRSVMVTMAGACFAYLGVGYATHINELSTSGALAICGLYYAVRIRRGQDAKPWHWPLTGLVLGIMPAIDLPCLAITGGLALYLFTFDKKKTLLWFLPALLPGVLMHLALTYQISGSLRPFYFNSSLKTFKQFYFKQPGGIDGLREPKLLYAYNTLIGHHGLFSMTPLYCFGLYELLRCLSARRLLAESLVVVGAVVAFLAFFILRTRNYGGWCVGMRWLVPIMPLLLLYFGVWIRSGAHHAVALGPRAGRFLGQLLQRAGRAIEPVPVLRLAQLARGCAQPRACRQVVQSAGAPRQVKIQGQGEAARSTQDRALAPGGNGTYATAASVRRARPRPARGWRRAAGAGAAAPRSGRCRTEAPVAQTPSNVEGVPSSAQPRAKSKVIVATPLR